MSRFVFGIIGKPLTHSFSPDYFKHKFSENGLPNCSYLRFELDDISELDKVIESNPHLIGLNVTTPYKQCVIPFLNELRGAALDLKSVNTILFHNKKRIGYNTDVNGFEYLLRKSNLIYSKGAMILGSGGSSVAVQYVLKQLDIPFIIISRNSEKKDRHKKYESLSSDDFKNYPFIIHCTPLGMYPNADKCVPFPFGLIDKNNTCIDLIYNPEKTLFLQQAEACGAHIINGYDMLIAQADAAWTIWKPMVLETEKLNCRL